jgi:hypothetical protein
LAVLKNLTVPFCILFSPYQLPDSGKHHAA